MIDLSMLKQFLLKHTAKHRAFCIKYGIKTDMEKFVAGLVQQYLLFNSALYPIQNRKEVSGFCRMTGVERLLVAIEPKSVDHLVARKNETKGLRLCAIFIATPAAFSPKKYGVYSIDLSID